MSLETRAAAAPSHKPSATAGSHGARAKTAQAERAPDEGSAGFMAILSAVDAGGELASDPSAPLDALASGLPPGLPVPPVFDASAWLQQNPQMASALPLRGNAAPTMDTAQPPGLWIAQTAVGTQPLAADAGVPGGGALSNALTGAGGLAASDFESAADLAPNERAAALAIATAAIGKGMGAAPAAPAATGTLAAAALGASVASAPAVPVAPAMQAAVPQTLPGDGLVRLDQAPNPGTATADPGDAQAKAAAPALPGAGGAAASAGAAVRTAVAAEPALPGWQRATARAKVLADTTGNTAAASSAAAPGRTEPDTWMRTLELARVPAAMRGMDVLPQPLQELAERPAGAQRAGLELRVAEPAFDGNGLGLGVPDFSQPVSPSAALAPEQQVAEQVSYWVSQNVQNAELQIGGAGESPVQVSISMQGNEAQISFQSDESATREVLERAGAQLKDMLLSEGVVLTGVSIGGAGSGRSGQGAGDGGQRRPRDPEVRQSATGPLQAASANSAPRPRARSGAGGPAVDLFV